MEHVKNTPKLASLGIDGDVDMAINCEWGAFDSFEHEHLPRTKYDAVVDETSNKPGEQAFEVRSGPELGIRFSCTTIETYIWKIPWGDIPFDSVRTN